MFYICIKSGSSVLKITIIPYFNFILSVVLGLGLDANPEWHTLFSTILLRHLHPPFAPVPLDRACDCACASGLCWAFSTFSSFISSSSLLTLSSTCAWAGGLSWASSCFSSSTFMLGGGGMLTAGCWLLGVVVLDLEYGFWLLVLAHFVGDVGVLGGDIDRC